MGRIRRFLLHHYTNKGGAIMKGSPEDRAVSFAQYIIETGATVRETAKKYNISKSTVHTVVK